MPEIYTSNDLIRFIYNETELSESEMMIGMMKDDVQIAAEFEQLQETVSLVESASLDAHPTSIQLILEHSRKLNEEMVK